MGNWVKLGIAWAILGNLAHAATTTVQLPVMATEGGTVVQEFFTFDASTAAGHVLTMSSSAASGLVFVDPDSDHGDITVSADGATWTIDAATITNAKMANMAQDTFKGRADGAGTGAPTDLSATQGLAIIETVDGSGSGLDADLLDNLSSAAFALATHTHAESDVTNLTTDLAAKAPIASPTFTGTVTIPTGAVLNTPASVTLTNGTGYLASALTGDRSEYNAPGADVTITSVDAAICSRTVTGLVAGQQINVEGMLTYLNDSTATRAPIITIDFDDTFDIELQASAMATSSTLRHPAFFRGVLDIRATNLAYEVSTVEWELAAGRASGEDSTVAQTHLRAMGWGTTTNDLTGSTNVKVYMRTGANTATQTARVHQCSVRVITP